MAGNIKAVKVNNANQNNTVDQIAQTNAALEFARDLVQNYVLKNIVYPTKQGYFQATATNFTANSFQFYIGTSSYANSYVNGGVVQKADGTDLVVNNFTYDYTTGIATITTTTTHGLSINDTVQVSDINVSCTYDGVVTNKVYPELTAQANAGTFTVESGDYHSTGPTASTFDIYVGPSKYAHTYVSGGKVYKGQAFLTPTDATYDPATGVMVVTVGSHSLTTVSYTHLTLPTKRIV